MITIDSNSIKITSVTYKDINTVWLDTLNNREYMNYSKNSTSTWNLNLQKEYLKNFDNYSTFLLKIECKKIAKFVGTISVKFHFHLQQVEIGILIFKEFANNGYATKSIKAIDFFLSNNFPNFKLIMGTHKHNYAMQNVIKKNGLILEKKRSLDTLNYYKTYKQFTDGFVAEIPLILQGARTLGVVAYDYGGAEQILYLIKNLKKKLLFRVDGPAREIFRKEFDAASEFVGLEPLLDCDLILVGSGWMSNLETEAIDFFSSRNKLFITILDHWENYELRFKILEHYPPKLLLVSNESALKKAQIVFPSSSIWIMPDFLINYYKRRLRTSKSTGILVILEPLASSSNLSDLTFKDYTKIIRKALVLLEKYNLTRVILRLHPSQNKNEKYIDKISKEFPKIFWSKNSRLIDDLKLSGIVLGFHSNALYLAAKCGIRVASMYKRRRNHWTNEIPEIQSFNEL